MPSRRLLLSSVASLVLHLLLLGGGGLFSQTAPVSAVPRDTPAVLAAKIASMPDRLLKDTLTPMAAAESSTPHPTPASDSRGRKSVAAARRQLAEHLYYPPEAIRLGLEGETKLLLTLGANGAIVDVAVAAGSGHAILDQAALRAAWAMGRLPGTDRRELLLPVIFRLRP